MALSLFDPHIEITNCCRTGGILQQQHIHTIISLLFPLSVTFTLPNSTDSSVAHTVCLFVVCLLVGCLTSQQQARVSQGRICSDNCSYGSTGVASDTLNSLPAVLVIGP